MTDKLLPAFCQYCFSSDYVRSQITSTCSYTTRALTNGTLLSGLWLAIPSPDEQRLITEAMDSISSRLKSVQHYLSPLKLIKKALMQDLLTGKVRVTVN